MAKDCNRPKPQGERPRRRRNCMCCGGPFTSEGPQNRLCAICRKSETTPFDGMGSSGGPVGATGGGTAARLRRLS